MNLTELFQFQDWDISGLDIGVMVGYFVLMVVVGLACRNMSSNVSDYIRMGCKSPWWLLGLSIFMQTFSAITFTGNCGQAYLAGWSALLIGGGAVFGLLCQAIFFAPWLRRTRAITPADAVRQRFGPAVEQIYTYVGASAGMLWGGVMLLGLANFVAATFNIPVVTVIFFVGVIIIFYSVSGGSWSVQITDSLQAFILIPICALVAYLSLQVVGGFSGLLSAISEKGLDGDFQIIMPPEHVYVTTGATVKPGYFTWPWVIASFLFAFIQSANMTNCHRYLSTKDDGSARKAAILAAGLIVAGSLTWYIPPMVGRVAFEQEINALARVEAPAEAAEAQAAAEQVSGEALGETSEGPGAEGGEAAVAAEALAVASAKETPEPEAERIKLNNAADGAYAVVAKRVLPPGLLGLVLIAMLAATMSSMDSALTGTAGLITNNLYPPLARLLGLIPWEGVKLLRLTQAVNLLLGLWAMLVAFLLFQNGGKSSIYDICLQVIVFVAAPVTLSMALAFFVRRLTVWAPLLGMACGFAGSAVFLFVGRVAGRFPDVVWLGGFAEWIAALKWHEQMSINSAVTLVPTLATVLFWRTATPAYRKKVEAFFKQIHTPIDFAKEVGEDADHALLRMVGGMGLVAAAVIATLIFTAEDQVGVWSVVFVVGSIAVVSGVMYWRGRVGGAAKDMAAAQEKPNPQEG